MYISVLSHEHSLSFTLRVQAKFLLVAKTPASSVYETYNPDVSGVEALV